MIIDFIHFILMPIVWLPIVIVLGFLTYRNYKRINQLKVLNVDSVLLMLEIPKNNDKQELSAEQMFASLHGILRDAELLKASGGVQEHLSFEIVSTGGQIRFYVWTPKAQQSFVEGQIYAQYPTVQIYTIDHDYVDNRNNHEIIYTSELGLTENAALPIKTFESFEVDPLAGITGTLAKLDPDHSEELWIQILTRPIADSWHKDTDNWIKVLKSGKSSFRLFNIDWSWLFQAIAALWTPPSGGTASPGTTVELSERAKSQITAAEQKAIKLGYEVKIRLVYLGNNEINAKLNMQALVGTFKQFNSTNLNGFKQLGGSFNKEDLDAYKMRQFTNPGFVLNISELASVYHLPHTSVETPNIVWATSKTAEPPAKLPLISGIASNDENISAFGLTNFRGINHQFGMLRRDRSRHIYIIGQTGAGKSGLLELFALSDIFYNQGYCIIDPHGDFAVNNLRFIPANRVKDVVYFNPADTQFPIAFNPLELSEAARKPNVCSEVIGVLKRMFGDSWGPRLEHILRFTLLALLDRPGSTLLDISRILTDREFRKETLDFCTDVTVLQFWKHEFGQWNEKQVNESIAPVLNKVGAFTANPIIRNIIGQPHSSFNIRKIMDEGKILVVNLSKGLIGEDNAGILGSFLVTKIQLAAMSRSDIPDASKRRPFYLYVDEFQNFATDSFSVILSEARKYGLNLTVANQYIAQMTDSVRDAVFGNVGTTISFRVSADDAPILVKQFEPTFDGSDLIQMNNRHFVISMIINGEKAPAFSATTLNIPETPKDNLDSIITSSREQYARNRADVEIEIRANIEQSEQYKKNLSENGRTSPKELDLKSSKVGTALPLPSPSFIQQNKSFTKNQNYNQDHSNQWHNHGYGYGHNQAYDHGRNLEHNQTQNQNRSQNNNRHEYNQRPYIKNNQNPPIRKTGKEIKNPSSLQNIKKKEQFISPIVTRSAETANISPNTMEGNDNPTLKDLGTLVKLKEAEKNNLNINTDLNQIDNRGSIDKSMDQSFIKHTITSKNIKSQTEIDKENKQKENTSSHNPNNQSKKQKKKKKKPSITPLTTPVNTTTTTTTPSTTATRTNTTSHPITSNTTLTTPIATSNAHLSSTIFASDLHDGRPGIASSQNIPKGHQLDANGFRQNIQTNPDRESSDSGYLSIHH